MSKDKNKIPPDNEGDLLTLNSLMPELKAKITLLIDIISKQNPYFIGYDIERISKDDEKSCIVDGVQHLAVQPLDKWTELHSVLNSWKDFYAPIKSSTMFVHRLPGFVIVNEDKATVLSLVVSINVLKDKIAETVRCNRDKHQKHEFIHQAFAGVMTEQLYRKIQIKTDHVNNIWFNWVSRPVNQSYSLKEAQEYVEKKRELQPIEFSRDAWSNLLNKVIVDIKSGRYKTIQKLKQFRFLPTIEFNIIINGEKKRNKHNATTPFILLGQEDKANPTFTKLTDYIGQSKEKKVHVFNSKKEMIDPYLRLVGVK